jgi:hypothetical protein
LTGLKIGFDLSRLAKSLNQTVKSLDRQLRKN